MLDLLYQLERRMGRIFNEPFPVFDWKVQLFPLSFERQMPEMAGLAGTLSAAPRPR